MALRQRPVGHAFDGSASHGGIGRMIGCSTLSASVRGFVVYTTYWQTQMAYFGFFQTRLKSATPLSDYTPEQCEQAQALYLEALAHDDTNDLENAIVKYSAALDVVPHFFEALDNRGLCHMKLHDFVSAIPSFETSTQVNGDSPLALVALIKCYRETGSSSNAMHVSQYCIEKWPDKSPFPNWEELLG